MKELNSKRTYTVAFLEENTTYSNPHLSLDEILRDDPVDGEFEHIYAIQDNLDAVLDLKVGERLQMNFNRDNTDSAGFIKRIK